MCEYANTQMRRRDSPKRFHPGTLAKSFPLYKPEQKLTPTHHPTSDTQTED